MQMPIWACHVHVSELLLAKLDAGQKYTAPGRPRVEAHDWLGSGAVMKGMEPQMLGIFRGVMYLVGAEGAAVERWESVRRKEMLGNDNVECDILSQFEVPGWMIFTRKPEKSILVWMDIEDIDRGWRGARGVRWTKSRYSVHILCRDKETEQQQGSILIIE